MLYLAQQGGDGLLPMILAGIVALIAGLTIGYAIAHARAAKRTRNTDVEVKQILDKANRDAEAVLKAAKLSAKD